MLKWITLLFVIASNSVNCWAKDLSAEYMAAKRLPLWSEVQALQKYNVLVIPGVLAESFISDSDNQIKLNFLFEDGFSEQLSLLEHFKIDHQFLKLETENSPKENAKSIIDAIEKSTKPVLIYSHSKGGLDTLEAIRQRPAILSKIYGWASVQSPFWGAPVASGFDKNLIFRDSGHRIFEWMGGSASGMNSLTIAERETYMESTEIKKLILEIKHKIRVINFASFKKNRLGIDTPLELFRNYTQNKAGVNDGVVPLHSALMKEHGHNIDYIIEAEVDHLMTMTKYRLDNVFYDQQLHTLALLKLLL